MFGINQDQVTSALRWILATGGGYLAGRGFLTADTVTALAGLAPALGAFLWSMFVHKNT